MVDLVELDKQAHKFIIAYFIAKLEDDINFTHLIEAGIFEFLRRVVVTDIRPDVFRKALQQKSKEINTWVVGKLKSSIENIENGNFLQKFEEFLNDPNMYKKERFILKAASYLSTKWEFSIVYQTSQFLSDIEEVKKAVDAEIEDYYELIGVRKMALNKKLAKIVDLSGRLRFQKRWAQTPRIPETSVLGHMLTVALFSYFYSLEVKACDKRLQNNFFTALFHDLPEALTRDIISPVKYSVDELSEIIAEYEVAKIKEEIANKVKIDGNITEVDDINKYNLDKYEAIDGLALKQCDKLSAFVEASLSISHGIKSKELISCKKIAIDIDSEFGSNGQIQTTLDFE